MFQNDLRRTEPGYRWLEQVESNESGEKKPDRIDPVAERETRQQDRGDRGTDQVITDIRGEGRECREASEQARDKKYKPKH